MAFVYSTRKGSTSVIGAMRTIGIDLNTGADAGTEVTDVVTGLNWIAGSATSTDTAVSNEWIVQVNTPDNGTARVTGAATATTGVLTLFGYGGG